MTQNMYTHRMSEWVWERESAKRYRAKMLTTIWWAVDWLVVAIHVLTILNMCEMAII